MTPAVSLLQWDLPLYAVDPFSCFLTTWLVAVAGCLTHFQHSLLSVWNVAPVLLDGAGEWAGVDRKKNVDGVISVFDFWN